MNLQQLPSPEAYDDWKSFAQALVRELQNASVADEGFRATVYAGTVTVDPSALPAIPEGYHALWLSDSDAELFLANPAYDPPTAPDRVYIDSAAIADAAVTVGKVRDGAVTNAKLLDGAVDALKIAAAAVGNVALATNAVASANIQNAAIVNAKIGTGAILTANIGSAQVLSANIADGNIITAKILDGAILQAKIGDAAIVSAKIGDGQIISAKIGLLEVNGTHIANAAISSAKIANASIGAAHIIDASITNAKIEGVIQSNTWNDTTKAGWKLDKAGNIQGQGIAIYDTAGNLVFGSGGTLALSRITGAGALAGLNSLSLGGGYLTGFGNLAALNSLALGTSYLTGFGSLAGLNSLSLGGGYLTGFGAFAGLSATDVADGLITGLGNLATEDQITAAGQIATGIVTALHIADGTITATELADYAIAYGSSKTIGFGTLAAISLLTSGNISTYIAGAAIGSALIANAAIGTAHIDNLAVTGAKIADATIGSAKIADLAVDKITGGTLGVQIYMGSSGRIIYDNGTYMRVQGLGFGSSNQFLEWFGPHQSSLSACTEANAIQYLKTDGDAYFGGSLSAGVLYNSITGTGDSSTANVTLGPFSSNGNNKTVTLSYSYDGLTYGNGASPSFSTPTAQIKVWRGTDNTGTLVATLNVSGSAEAHTNTTELDAFGNLWDWEYHETMGGSVTATDAWSATSGLNYYAEITARSINGGETYETQRITVVSVES